jgi:DUF971 family protein
MNPRLQEPALHNKEDATREGIVVWDQKGLVVRWPDGHCSRFLWEVLRQVCLCAECRTSRTEQTASAESFSMDIRASREEAGLRFH